MISLFLRWAGCLGILFMSFCFPSCESSINREIENLLAQEVNFERTGLISIGIDSTTSNYASFYHASHIAGKPYLVIRNYPMESLLIFDLDKNILSKRIPFDHDGPNMVNEPKGILLHSMDSIFISDYARGLLLMKGNGEIVDKFSIGFNSEFNEYDGIVSMRSGNAMSKIGRFIVYANPEMSYERKAIEQLNLTEKTVTELLPFPEFYQDDQLEGIWYDRIYSDFNTQSEEVIIGFNLLSDFYTIAKDGTVTYRETGFADLCIKCHYFKYSGDPRLLTDRQFNHVLSNFYQNYSFMNVMYDRVNNLVYRLLKAPTSSYDFENLAEPKRYEAAKYYILVFDAEKFQYKGALELNGTDYWISPNNYFLFSARGLIYVARRDGSEDEFLFETFKVLP